MKVIQERVEAVEAESRYSDCDSNVNVEVESNNVCFIK